MLRPVAIEAAPSPSDRRGTSPDSADPAPRAGGRARRAAPSWIAVAAIAGAGVIILVVHALRYPPYLVDDAYISLRYAQRLLAGHGLTWTDGEHVEGYSNLLWLLACAGLGALGVGLVDAARSLGLATMSAALVIVVIAARASSPGSLLPAAAGALALALSPSVAYWATAGLEQPLVAALLAGAAVLSFGLVEGQAPAPLRWRDALKPGIPLGLLCLTRPDGPLFALVGGAGIAVFRARGGDGWRALVRVGAVPALAVLGQLAFRLAYYGDWIPNTARVKVALTSRRLLVGLDSIERALLPLGILWLATLLAVGVTVVDPRRRARIGLVLFLLGAWTAYVVVAGGDPMHLHRLLVPSVILMVLLLVETLAWTVGRGDGWRVAAWVGAGLAIALHTVAGQVDLSNRNALIVRPPVTWRRVVIGNVLRQAFGPQRPLLAVDSAGIMPYYSQLPALDMLGLNDRYLATHRPASFGRGHRGHELGDGGYVLERAPDLIVGGLAGDSRSFIYRSGIEMERDPRFPRWYQCVQIEGDDPQPARFYMWVRREGAVGIQRGPSRVTIPGYLFATAPTTVARLDPQGRLGTVLRTGEPGRLADLEIPEGRWRVEPSVMGAAVTVRILPADSSTPVALGSAGLRFHAQPAHAYAIEVGVASDADRPAHLLGLALHRD